LKIKFLPLGRLFSRFIGIGGGFTPTTPNYTRTASPKGRISISFSSIINFTNLPAGRQAFNL
jgi:hypothetical protein